MFENYSNSDVSNNHTASAKKRVEIVQHERRALHGGKVGKKGCNGRFFRAYKHAKCQAGSDCFTKMFKKKKAGR